MGWWMVFFHIAAFVVVHICGRRGRALTTRVSIASPAGISLLGHGGCDSDPLSHSINDNAVPRPTSRKRSDQADEIDRCVVPERWHWPARETPTATRSGGSRHCPDERGIHRAIITAWVSQEEVPHNLLSKNHGYISLCGHPLCLNIYPTRLMQATLRVQYHHTPQHNAIYARQRRGLGRVRPSKPWCCKSFLATARSL
jgi:hypothetical protein